MENNLLKITERVYGLIHEFSPVFMEDVEMEIIHTVADEILEGLGENKQDEDIQKALVNMFIAGRMFPENQKIDLKK